MVTSVHSSKHLDLGAIMNNEFCDCGMPWIEDDDTCSKCKKEVAPNRLESARNIIETSKETTTSDTAPSIQKHASNKDYLSKSIDAALRTSKYATLFEKIGSIMQVLNSIGAVILILVGFALDTELYIRVAYWITILFLWAIAYIQTSFIRGLASYFQMKANSHLSRIESK